MSRGAFLVALVALGAAPAMAVSPVQKVIQLLNGMVEKGKKEKHEEQVQFAAYKQFCDDTTVEKQRAIKEANEMIEMLQADIEKYEADAARLAKEIAKHDEDISTWEGDFKAATKVREIENADYIATHKDYTESIDALDEGIQTLKAQAHDVKQAAAALTQVSSSNIVPAESKRIIDAFLAQDPDENLAVAAPEANAYEFQAQGIVDMLTKLGGKFEDERTELEKEETNARHAFEMLSQDLKAQIDQATQARTEKAEAKAKALQAAADSKGDLQDTTTTRDDDSKYLADLTATCEQKSAAFAERQQLRADEIAAVEKAIEILSSGAVSGASEKHLPQLMQSSALAQLRAEAQNPNQLRVAAYLREQGSRINSRVLSALAMRVSEDPFKKVKKMIKDLIYKLMEEAREEAEHQGWCNTELTTNKQTRDKKSADIESLNAEIEELTAEIAKLTQDLSDLQAAVKELDEAMAKATSDRTASKEKNQATIKDAKGAQEAVAQAIGVLKDFYAKAAEATALAQQSPGEDAPESFDEPAQGQQAAGGGVIDFLEVITADFARLESETTTDEESEQEEFETFMFESKKDKALKENDMGHKTEKKTAQEGAVHSAKQELAVTQEELDAAMAYFEKLKPTCVDSGITYEERVKRREAEIQSLKEALQILSGESI